MSFSLLKKYIWLVDTIRSVGHISREEISRKWSYSSANEKKEPEYSESTFHRNINEIRSLFNIDIQCNRTTGQYYIAESDLTSQTMQWLLSQFAVSQSLDTSRELRDRILYEPIPEGSEYLTTIVNAMHDSQWLHITHQRFDSDATHEFYLAPYCLKVFKQRWYVFGAKCELDERLAVNASSTTRIYALDRVKKLEISDKTFKLPKNFDAEQYFAHSYGVFCGYEPELIRARFDENAAPYVRTLPLHPSQKEVEPCVFEWYLAPTLDFIQQLRTQGSQLEILAPQSLRDQFIKEAQDILGLYKK